MSPDVKRDRCPICDKYLTVSIVSGLIIKRCIGCGFMSSEHVVND